MKISRSRLIEDINRIYLSWRKGETETDKVLKGNTEFGNCQCATSLKQDGNKTEKDLH